MMEAAGRHRAGRGIDPGGAGLPPRHAQGRRRMGRRLVVQGVGPGRAGRRRHRRPRGLGAPAPNDDWHGFGDLADGFNMLDPIKATVITPGLDVDGDVQRVRHPGGHRDQVPGRARHRSSRRRGLYSFFIMFTIGITKGRWNTLVTELQQFKDDYDQQPAAVARAAGVRRPPIRSTSAWACATCATQMHERLQGQRRGPPDHARCTCRTWSRR